MKSLLFSLLLWLNGNKDETFREEYVSAKGGMVEIVDAYSAKSAEVYSAKGAKVPIEPPEFLMNPLDRLIFPVLPPMPPINPPPVTNVNP